MDDRPPSALRVLSWNLHHARDGYPGLDATVASTVAFLPVVGDTHLHLNRKLVDPMADAIAGAAPDVAMLQEVPPVALPRICARTRMRAVSVRTGPLVGSVRLRGRLGQRNPDLWRSHEGNANALLVGPGWRVVPGEVRAMRLNSPAAMVRALATRRIPGDALVDWAAESRRLVAAVLEDRAGRRVLIACAHCHSAPDATATEIRRVAGALTRWAGPLPVVLGGDINAPPAHPALRALAKAGFRQDVPGAGVDQIHARGLGPPRTARRWTPSEREITARRGHLVRRVRLSDHDPVEAVYELASG